MNKELQLKNIGLSPKTNDESWDSEPRQVQSWGGVCTEGLPFIFLSALFTILLWVLVGMLWAMPALCLTVFVLWFFRDPERTIPTDLQAIVSPADGKVIGVHEVDGHRDDPTPFKKISVFMSVFNVHVNRVPYEGRVTEVQYFPGKFFSAFKEKASMDNEQTHVAITLPNGERLRWVQIAGLIARRIVCHLRPGHKVERGMRFGMIRFGSRVDIYLPRSVDVLVRVGDRVRAGSSVIGRLS